MEPTFDKEGPHQGYCWDCLFFEYFKQVIHKGTNKGHHICWCAKYSNELSYYDGPLRLEECIEEYGE